MVSRPRCTSPPHILPSLRATAANSFRTCTLTLPPSAINFSASCVRGSSWTIAYTKMFVSRNALSLIRFVAVEDESGRKRTPEFTQLGQSAFAALIAAHVEGSFAGDLNLDIVAFFQIECLDHRGGQTNSQAVSPFWDLQGVPLSVQRYTWVIVYLCPAEGNNSIHHRAQHDCDCAS